jgi:hypothetical protein
VDPAWTREELENIMQKINEERFQRFSYRVGDTEYYIVLWMRYSDDDEVEEKLSDFITTAALEGITDWFLGASYIKHLKDVSRTQECLIAFVLSRRRDSDWTPLVFHRTSSHNAFQNG